MTKYEQLLSEHDYLDIQEMKMKNKGLYADSTIWINDALSETEKVCILAEELGHYHTSSGDILDQNELSNRKQERTARGWAYSKIIPLNSIRQAYTMGYTEPWEIAEYLDTDEQFLKEAMQYYEEKYGDEILKERREAEFKEHLKTASIAFDK